jgi:hypothetical protein
MVIEAVIVLNAPGAVHMKVEAADSGAEVAATTIEAASGAADASLDADDPWAGWTGCICGGGYHGEMVGCDGGCEDWFHFGCVGLKRQPRGDWVCSTCSTKAAKRRLAEEKRAASNKRHRGSDVESAQLSSSMRDTKPEKKLSRVEESLASTTERKGREDLELLINRARPLKFDPDGKLLEANDGESSRPCAGAGRLAPVAPEVFTPLRRLHGNIVAALRKGKMLQSWEGKGKEADLRARGFAFLPQRYGSFGKEHLQKGGLTFHAAEKQGVEAEIDEAANWKSCMTLRDVDIDLQVHNALEALLPSVRHVVPDKYKKFVELKHLMAIQPNLHNGATHLPPHLDFPLHDGFGVVIVTIQMTGAPAVVALCRGGLDTASIATDVPVEKRERCWTFTLRPGDAYVLAGDSRNYCDHGVLCLAPEGRRSQTKKSGDKKTSAGESRESLNLRFGLHPWKRGAACSAYREIYHQFDLDPEAKKKAKPMPLMEAIERALALANQLPSPKEERAGGAGGLSPSEAGPKATDASKMPHGLLWAKVYHLWLQCVSFIAHVCVSFISFIGSWPPFLAFEDVYQSGGIETPRASQYPARRGGQMRMLLGSPQLVSYINAH